MKSPSMALDIKLRNTGTKVAFLKRAKVHVEEMYNLNLQQRCQLGAAYISGFYNIRLPIQKTPYIVEKDISQTIDPNGIDRFVLFLKVSDDLDDHPYYVVKLRLDLVYDEDDKVVSSGEMMVIGPSTEYCALVNDDWEHTRDYAELNQEDTQNLLRMDSNNTKKSVQVERLVKLARRECVFRDVNIECDGESFELSTGYDFVYNPHNVPYNP